MCTYLSCFRAETFTAFLRNLNFLWNTIHKGVRHVPETLICSEGERASYQNISDFFRRGDAQLSSLDLT